MIIVKNRKGSPGGLFERGLISQKWFYPWGLNREGGGGGGLFETGGLFDHLRYSILIGGMVSHVDLESIKDFTGLKKGENLNLWEETFVFIVLWRWYTWPVLKSLKRDFQKKLIFHCSFFLEFLIFWNFTNAKIIWYYFFVRRKRCNKNSQLELLWLWNMLGLEI